MSILPKDAQARFTVEEQFELVCTSGRPFCYMDVRIMSADGHQLLPGSNDIGEVQCRGPTVFQEYWQDPIATQAAFQDGWFCTGEQLSYLRSSSMQRISFRVYVALSGGGGGGAGPFNMPAIFLAIGMGTCDMWHWRRRMGAGGRRGGGGLARGGRGNGPSF